MILVWVSSKYKCKVRFPKSNANCVQTPESMFVSFTGPPGLLRGYRFVVLELSEQVLVYAYNARYSPREEIVQR
jgi:hypothetical protein